MIRTGQMLLHEALKRHKGGQNQIHRFLDIENASFSIHKICENGSKAPGEWYGPSTILMAFKKILEKSPIDGFTMLVSPDGNIDYDQIESHLSSEGKTVFLGIPIRLGLDSIMPEYLACLKRVFQMP